MARDVPPLEGMDLNLLVTLRALLREGSVTRAARRLGQTQPTVSRALATLRESFADPLLVRAGRGMVLTPRAEAIRGPLEQALASVDRLRAAGDFEPGKAERVFRITMPDVLGAVVVPHLMGLVVEEAPGVVLQILGSGRDMVRSLIEDEVDVVVAAPWLDHPELVTRTIAAEVGWSVLHGPHHPCRGEMTLDDWLSAGHVMLSPHGRPDVRGHFDEVLSELGHTRRVRLHVGYLSALRDTLTKTQLVASLPTPVALSLARRSSLQVAPHPLGDRVSSLEVRMTWHRARHADPGHAWLRAKVVEGWECVRTSPS